MKTLGLLVGLTLLDPAVAIPQQVCPCVPLTYQWIVTPCETWKLRGGRDRALER